MLATWVKTLYTQTELHLAWIFNTIFSAKALAMTEVTFMPLAPKNKSLQPGQDCWNKAGKKQDMIAQWRRGGRVVKALDC